MNIGGFYGGREIKKSKLKSKKGGYGMAGGDLKVLLRVAGLVQTAMGLVQLLAGLVQMVMGVV